MDEQTSSQAAAWHSLGSRQILWQLVFSGVFDRYPNLKIQVAEARADWAPDLKWISASSLRLGVPTSR
jgi:hypothetical protein